jgi:membrane-associated protein
MHLSSILDTTHLLSAYGYAGIFVVIFIESGVFFFLPGDSLLFAAGLLAAAGKLSLVPVILLALLAAFFGNLVGYQIGIHVEKLRRYPLFRRLIKDEHMTRAHDFFERRGHIAILVARFIPGVRTFTPWVAGMARMQQRAFVVWSALGAVLWVVVMSLAGFFLGRAFPGLEKYLTEAIIIIIALSLVPAIFEWLRHRRTKAGPPAQAGE